VLGATDTGMPTFVDADLSRLPMPVWSAKQALDALLQSYPGLDPRLFNRVMARLIAR